MDLDDVMTVVNRESAAALSLSKGGWEGWIQCELWGYLSLVKNETVEREVPYPNSGQRCDLVVGSSPPQLWVEIKAFGIFREGDADRFLDSIAQDVYKLDNKPIGSSGLVLVIVPKGIGAAFGQALFRRGWRGFVNRDGEYVTVYYMQI